MANRPRSDCSYSRSSLIRFYTVCHMTHFSVCSNLRMITANILGVQKFKTLTVINVKCWPATVCDNVCKGLPPSLRMFEFLHIRWPKSVTGRKNVTLF